MPSFLTSTVDPEVQVGAAQEAAVPSYVLAADNHNLGNTRGGSWFDPSTWEDKFYGSGKFIAVSLLSGANSFYNTGVTISNWLGSDAELNDTKEWISQLDSDLGAYYSDHRQAADLVGFIASSLVPGLAGVKVLNAGQTVLKAAATRGLLGENLSRATGLLVPQTEKYIMAAANDITAASATFSNITQNGVRALASGVWQNVLEGAAFETAVQATMFRSPILEGQDKWDIVKNIAIGGAFSGVLGGAFTGAATYGKIKNLVVAAEKKVKPFSSRVLAEEGTTPAQKIILMTEDRDAAILSTPTDPVQREALKDRVRRTDNDIRKTYHEMVIGEDSELGNMIADASHSLNHETVLNNLLHAEEITRLPKVTKLEKEITQLAKQNKSDPTLSVQYVKLTGEGAGVVTDSEPVIVNLADRVFPTVASNTKNLVQDEVRSYKFKPGQLWNPLALSEHTGHLEAEARHIYASELLKEIPTDGTVRIHQYDIPLLERAYKDGIRNIELVDDKGLTVISKFNDAQEQWKHLVAAKETVANRLLMKHVLRGDIPVEQGTVAISKIVNTKLARLEGSALGEESKDYLAWQSAKEDYNAFLQTKGLSVPAAEHADPRFLPTYAKISKRATDIADLNGNVIDGMTYIKQQQSLLKKAVDNVVAKATGDLYDIIPEISDAALLTSNRYGAGAGLAKFANGAYGSLESLTQQLGNATKQLQVKFRKSTQDTLEGPLANLGRKQDTAIEWDTINQKVTRSAKQWVRHTTDDGKEEYLVTKEAVEKFRDPETNELDFDGLLSELPEDLIRIHNTETAQLVDAHIARSGSRTQTYRELRAAQGHQDVKDSTVFRPIRPNPKDYPFFAFVTDPRVTGQGHKTMIFAASEEKLQQMIGKVPTEYKVLTKRDVEEFKVARNEYEYQRTLHESYIDTDLKNRGIFSEFFTKTDPQKIVNDTLQQHLREDDMLAMELMRAKNQKAFDWLEDQGSAYTKVASSRFGTFSDRMESSAKNPYVDYIKTALNISKVAEHPLIYGFNRFLDTAVSKAVAHVNDVFANARSPAQLEEINQIISKYGMNTGYRDAALDLLANHTAPKGELTKFVRGANAILSKLTLGLDPLNAVNNFIGANVLRTTELKQITDAIKKGDNQLAGELGKLAHVNLPGGVGSIMAPTKLVAQAIRNFTHDDGTLIAQYKAAGYIKDMTQQFREIIDDFTLKGTESVPALNSRLNRAFEKAKVLSEVGERGTGNKFVEEFNRFISADVMRQITDLAVGRNLLTKQEQAAYINTFVNRVEGNTIASQRPLMFQGPIGQAVGLFQSYQFNLMQQMFRYVAEGTAKDSAMLLGLQGTFYGIQGLPAFQFINQHIVGTLSGNTSHRDLYDATYGAVGSQLGDLLLYGLPSNILQANIYSRGDINPRQLTVIPTSLTEVPFVGAFGKFLGSLKDTFDRINNGGPLWESMLQGLEHNGLSRPLAGFAQTFQAAGTGGVSYSTTSQGSILFSNDLMSWASAVRLAGGRPLDEAIINDGVFRIQSYQQYDRNKMNDLAQGIKAASINGNTPDREAMATFAKKYAEAGGKQINFNKFMMNEYKSANTNQSEKILRSLQNPFAQKMQLLMGGGSDATPFTSNPSSSH